MHGEGIAFPEKWQKDRVKIKVKEHAKNLIRCFLVDGVLGLPAIDDVVEVVSTVVDHSWISDHAYVPVRSDCQSPTRLKDNHRIATKLYVKRHQG